MILGFAGFMLGALGIAVPVILHLIKKKPKEIQLFPSFMFLRETVADKQSRNNIFKWLILLLRTLILLMIALAFARPFFPEVTEKAKKATIILWDNSFSMDAKPIQREMEVFFNDEIEKVSADNPILLGFVNDKVIWSNENFTIHKSDLLRDFKAREKLLSISDFEKALHAADRKLKELHVSEKEIIVFTDHQRLPWRKLKLQNKLSPGVTLRILKPHKPGFKNVSIEQTKLITPFMESTKTVDLKIKINNFCRVEMPCKVYITHSDKSLKPIDMNLKAYQINELIVTLQVDGSKPLAGIVKIVVKDDLEEDNQNWFSANPEKNYNCLMTSLDKNKIDYLALALKASEKASSLVLSKINTDTSDVDLLKANVLILREGLSANKAYLKKLKELIEKGKPVISILNESVAMKKWLKLFKIKVKKNKIGNTHFGNINFDHGIFKKFLDVKIGSLYDIVFFDTQSLEFPLGSKTIATFENGSPAIVEMKIGKGIHIIVCSSIDRNKTDWMVKGTFLPFCREVIAFCLQKKVEDIWTVGQRSAKIKTFDTAVELKTKKETKVINNRIVFSSPGHYVIKGKDFSNLISVNLPREESDPLLLKTAIDVRKLISTEVEVEMPTVGSLTENEKKDEFIWWVILIVCFGLMFSEMFLSNRTAI
ncbi:MAG: hypothetical protein COA79_14450 [Planctomycetota bacterium]|nr:MAG: hypothetical protein COA79_14450 [Planctomycetota bacterium]